MMRRRPTRRRGVVLHIGVAVASCARKHVRGANVTLSTQRNRALGWLQNKIETSYY
jgi:hypothetical protein